MCRTLPEPAHEGVAVLFSCSRGQKAFETAKLGKGHGVFFYHVIEGLAGKVENEDGEVTWDNLSACVKRQVRIQVPKLIARGARQTPHGVGSLVDDPVLLRPGKEAVRRTRDSEKAKGKDTGKVTPSPRTELAIEVLGPKAQKDLARGRMAD